MRVWLIDRLEKKVRPLQSLCCISVKQYDLTKEECDEMMRRGIVFDVDRMGKKAIHFSMKKLQDELRNKVMAKQQGKLK